MFSNILFLDLEDTVIDYFDDGSLLPYKISAIKQHIEQNEYDQYAIFSAAFWRGKEKEQFIDKWKECLEGELGVEFNMNISPTIQSLMESYCVKKRFHRSMFDMNEYFEHLGKEESFWLFSERWSDCHLTLIDDSVRNIEMNYKDSNVVLEMLNIDDMRN